MATADSSRKALLEEIESLRVRLEEAEDTLRAIGSGEVDAFMVSGPEGEQVFTLKGAEQSYRILVETMNEGAATLAADGTILYCNSRLAAMLQVPLERLVGMRFDVYVAPTDRPVFLARLGKCHEECDKDEIALITGAGTAVPTMISCCTLDLSGNREISVVVTDLTQQKRNEQIVASELLARSVIEQAGEAIIVCDEEGRIIRASRLAQELCGENPLLKPFDELFRLRIADTESRFSVSTPLHGGSFERVEVEFIRGEDQIFNLILNATPLKSAQNLIIGCVVTLTDITERRQVEEALRESEARLQAVLQQLPVGVGLMDRDGRWVLTNPIMDAFVPRAIPSTLPERRVRWRAYDSENRPVPPENWPGKRALRGETVSPGLEMIYTEDDGSERWMRVSAAPMRDAAGQIIGATCVVQDINLILRSEQRLRESEERLSLALEGGQMGLWEWGVRNNVLVWNSIEYQMLGLPVGDGTVETHQFFDRVHPEDAAPFNQILADVMKDGSDFYHEIRIFRVDDGQERWLAAAGRLLRDAAGQPVKMVGVNYDITERKRAEEALKRLNEELEKRVEERTSELREKDQMLLLQSRQAAMGEMIGNIAHQWRQPLNALGIVIQQLLLFYDLGEFDRALLEKNVTLSKELIKHMSTTIDDFRHFFRPDKNKVEFKVTGEVAATLSLIEDSFKNQQIAIEVVAKDEPVIFGYQNEYGQVLLNILNNARDALTERGIEDPRVTITIGIAEHKTVVTVADNAGGIPAEIMDKIFDPYFTTKGPQQGTGVGLFMAKTIIEKNMGGRLSARNTAAGAEFRIEV